MRKLLLWLKTKPSEITKPTSEWVIGISYTIVSIGTTAFTSIGASANTVGIVFTATGVGVGTGTASPNANSNSCFGSDSGSSITVGSNNVVIGGYTGAAAAPISATGSNYIVLSDGAVTITAGTAHTYVGNTVIAISTTGSFRTRKTAANTYVTYRIG